MEEFIKNHKLPFLFVIIPLLLFVIGYANNTSDIGFLIIALLIPGFPLAIFGLLWIIVDFFNLIFGGDGKLFMRKREPKITN